MRFRYSDNNGTERPPCPRCVHFDGEKRLKCRGRVDKDKCQHFDVDGRVKEEEKNKKKRVDTKVEMLCVSRRTMM